MSKQEVKQIVVQQLKVLGVKVVELAGEALIHTAKELAAKYTAEQNPVKKIEIGEENKERVTP